MKQIIDNFMALGPKRLTILGLTGLAIVSVLIFGLSAVLAPVYRPVAGDLSASEGAAMVRALEQAGYKPRISEDGSLVSLPEGDLARARMTLAEAGVAAEGLPGWELFDEQSGLGMNTFLQRVNRLRAMEGELARSVQTLDVVESARVHLVLPEREAFASDRPEPSAAVIIRTKRGMELDRRQAMSVRSLVAAALPGLAPGRVTVLSASGETLLAAEGEATDASGSIHAARIAIEDRLARNIEQMLSARVGAGNVRVRVAAELATAREVILKESFDPESQVARQTRSVSEAASNQEGDGESVDVMNNLPGGLGLGENGSTRSENRERAEDETRFEIGSTRTETVIEPGAIRRLSVAVLVNGTTSAEGYQDRSADELERLSQLVRSTMGFEEARGDFVTVDSLQFIEDGGVPQFERANTLAEDLLAYLPGLLRWLIALAIVAIIVFFAIRPALARLTPRAPEPPEPAEELPGESPAEAVDQKAVRKALDPASPAGETDEATDSDQEEFVSLALVRGAVTRRHLESLGALVESENDAALRLIRVWLHEKS
ncbi:flagellar basal-body MS-ring/collar protein FliF [Pseudogemmobacter faecipullorum]|uniref:Flagellar M-ring protein n=1 Tax=Pseudogemmobacter faecipullorum TaxID=2755041 RepID=A0ABS8CN72_9RHOB|nr:flagellar basal-body MS-ring/collar protein FliF [Pseudogemmobacter faecipullorum]MCB5410852.1 flagellar M-ring protein FliF [Pseudogemmobacter faecipullorum]